MQTRKKLVLAEFLPFRLSVATNLVSDAVATTYAAAFGLGIPEWRLIAVVAEAEAINQLEICRRTRMDKVTVSRAAGALVNKKLLQRTSNPDDRRSHLLALTGDGRRLYARIAPKALEIENQIFRGFTAAELRVFTSMLGRIETAAIAAGRQSRGRR